MFHTCTSDQDGVTGAGYAFPPETKHKIWETVTFRKLAMAIRQWKAVWESCPTRCDPMDCGILQARILALVAVPFSKRSFQPRDRIQFSCVAGGFFTSWATGEAQWKAGDPKYVKPAKWVQ